MKVQWNHRLHSLRAEENGVTAEIAQLDQMAMGYPIQRTEWVVAKTSEWHPRFVIGADGHDSAVRRMSGIGTKGMGTAITMSVFEVEAKGDLPEEARVVLDPDRVSIYWPLEPGRCRWGFQIRATSEHDASVERLGDLLATRAPWFTSRPTDIYWSTLALFETRIADRFGQGAAWLVGDAAHLASPIGVQSMNVGLREASDLATSMAAILRGAAPKTALEEYDAAARADWQARMASSPTGMPAGGAPWVERNRSRILPCVPASGADLAPLLRQIGLA